MDLGGGLGGGEPGVITDTGSKVTMAVVDIVSGSDQTPPPAAVVCRLQLKCHTPSPAKSHNSNAAPPALGHVTRPTAAHTHVCSSSSSSSGKSHSSSISIGRVFAATAIAAAAALALLHHVGDAERWMAALPGDMVVLQQYRQVLGAVAAAAATGAHPCPLSTSAQL